MKKREKVCFNCRHCNGSSNSSDDKYHCNANGSDMGYVECVTGWCRHWSKERGKNDGK